MILKDGKVGEETIKYQVRIVTRCLPTHLMIFSDCQFESEELFENLVAFDS